MNYSVLARKWRPKSLQEMVGQESILTIIANSFSQNRLHHAYLLCGTRGVGKTTLARIFSKCLNCVTGPTAAPCNQCPACQQIDKGNYPDLIEIDAASRTKVEDTREILDNIQYAPTSGKYKVYLIDEVHMLSGHSFNALLKTLEEPPAHVKFLLATTDPQKLPITVLSRCLKLTLKPLTISQISTHLETILNAEKIQFDHSALVEIAQAAQGSMRDALSILDQAIVFCDDKVSCEKVSQLLGTETKHLNLALLEAILSKQDERVFSLTESIEEKGGDFLRVTDDLLHLLHHIAIYQKNPRLLSVEEPEVYEAIPVLSKKASANDIQLLYQIMLTGKRDLPFAPTMRIGFDILLLRAMDFYPLDSESTDQSENKSTQLEPTSKNPIQTKKEMNAERWPEIVRQLNLKGITLTIAHQASIGKTLDNRLELILPERYRSLCHEKQQQLLSDALTHYMGSPIMVEFSFIDLRADKIDNKPLTKLEMKQEEPDVSTENDPHLAQLLDIFDANIHDITSNKGK